MRLLPDAASCCQLCLQLLPDAALPLLASLPLFPLAPRPATALSRRPSQQQLPDGSLPQCSQPAAFAGCPYQQLRHGTPGQQVFPMAPPCQQQASFGGEDLRFGYQSGAPGPDLLTRSCGVRRFAAPINISAHLPCCHIGRCSDRANLSAHLHRLPTPPPYLRRMRLSPGRGAGVGWQMMLLVVRIAVPANHRARKSLF